MKVGESLLTVSQVAHRLKVSEETVRRWIRSKSLSATRAGREFLISEWHLESFIMTGGKPLYENSDLLTTCSQGFRPAFLGSHLFDQAYFEVEKQWERIHEDRIQFEKGERREMEELRETQVGIEAWAKKVEGAHGLFNPSLLAERPAVKHIPNYWSLPLRTLFVDIHFYFVAAERLHKSTKKLKEDIVDLVFSEIVDRYDSIFKEINEIRRYLEHIDEKITHPEFRRDLGNIDDRGFHFGNKYYNFYISEIRKLRNELCDFFLLKTLPEKDVDRLKNAK
jgi:excisionase family DNA binding protein